MKRVFNALIVCLITLLICCPAFAADDTRTGTPVDTSQKNQNISSSQMDYDEMQSIVDDLTNELAPNVTTEDIVGKLESKGNDVVRILQTIGKYVCFSAFIICCLLVLIGVIGNKRLLAGAVIGGILSGLAYAGIVCGKEIVNWIAAWAAA